MAHNERGVGRDATHHGDNASCTNSSPPYPQKGYFTLIPVDKRQKGQQQAHKPGHTPLPKCTVPFAGGQAAASLVFDFVQLHNGCRVCRQAGIGVAETGNG